jgi:hypothetical protein
MIIYVNTIDKLMEHWAFLKEGLVAMNDHSIGRFDYTEEEFFKMLANLGLDSKKGSVQILSSERGVLLGFIVLEKLREPCARERVHIHVLFSNKKKPNGPEVLKNMASEWTRLEKIKRLTVETGRITSPAARFFEKQLKFRRSRWIFETEVWLSD